MARVLKPEDRISHYRIVGPLGAGGMGEVYRAHDERLERDVALKVLPPGLVRSEERLRRFTLEAKSASSLNHPHIVQIYEIGEEPVRREGSFPAGAAGSGPTAAPAEPGSSPLRYIAMELVSGTTLAARIHDERCELKTLLSWLAQAAEGVAKAHAAGIVHRDLKPGNVMVSSDGYAKVLDFGLAKLTEPVAGEAGLSTAPTMAAGEPTSAGVVVGTAGYMAPEQVRGQAVDARADVFAFGCMLYEAATRRRPFAAGSQVETLHRILHDAPAPVEELNPAVPAELRRLIRRCLAKDPNQRPQSMRDLALELREIVEEYDQLSASASSGSGLAAVAPAKRGRGLLTLGIVVGVSALVVSAVLVLLHPGPPRLNPDMRTRAVDVPLSGIEYPGLSQDGRWIALPAEDANGVSGLYLMNASGGEVRQVAVDSSVVVTYADISPDGSRIAYNAISKLSAGEPEVRVVPALGGPVRTVVRGGVSPRWSPDGQRIGYLIPPLFTPSNRWEFWTVRSDGSDRSKAFVDSISETGAPYGFAWSPGGRGIAWLRNFGHSFYNEIVIHDLATGHERQLTHDRKVIDEVAWTPRNEIVFSSNRGGATNLWVMRASGGTPTQLTRGAGPDAGVRVSADGRTLLYLIHQQLLRVGWWNVETGEQGVTLDQARPITVPLAVSPDSRQIAVRVQDSDALTPGALLVMNRDGTGMRTLVPGEEHPTSFDWSPDGRSLAWATASADGRSMEVHIVNVRTGETQTTLEIPAPDGFNWLMWPDPDTLTFLSQRNSYRYSLSARRVVFRSADREFVLPNRVPGWVVLMRRSDSTPRPGIYARPAGGGAERLVVPLAWLCANPSQSASVYCWPESLGFCRVELPSGKLTRVAHGPPVGRITVFWPSRDGRVLFWSERREASKLMLMENLHK